MSFLSETDFEFTLTVERDVQKFLSLLRCDNKSVALLFPPLNNYRRFQIHSVIQEKFSYYDLRTLSVGKLDCRRTVVFLGTDSLKQDTSNTAIMTAVEDKSNPKSELTRMKPRLPSLPLYQPPAARENNLTNTASPLKTCKTNRINRNRRPDMKIYVPIPKRILLVDEETPKNDRTIAPPTNKTAAADTNWNDAKGNGRLIKSTIEGDGHKRTEYESDGDEGILRRHRIGGDRIILPTTTMAVSLKSSTVKNSDFESDNDDHDAAQVKLKKVVLNRSKFKKRCFDNYNADKLSDDVVESALLSDFSSISSGRQWKTDSFLPNSVCSSAAVADDSGSSNNELERSDVIIDVNRSDRFTPSGKTEEETAERKDGDVELLIFDKNTTTTIDYVEIVVEPNDHPRTTGLAVLENKIEDVVVNGQFSVVPEKYKMDYDESVECAADERSQFLTGGDENKTTGDESIIIETTDGFPPPMMMTECNEEAIDGNNYELSAAECSNDSTSAVEDRVSDDRQLDNNDGKNDDENSRSEFTTTDKSKKDGGKLSVDNCNWDELFDENGEYINEDVMEELMSALGNVSIKRAPSNYREFQTMEERSSDGESIIEIYGFPAEFKTGDLVAIFSDFKEDGFQLSWVDDTHALGIFNNPSGADRALNTEISFAKTRPLREALPKSKHKAKSFILPPVQRPKTCVVIARRLVSGALGVKIDVTDSQRQAENRLLSDARAKKKQERREKRDIWEGAITDTTNTTITTEDVPKNLL